MDRKDSNHESRGGISTEPRATPIMNHEGGYRLSHGPAMGRPVCHPIIQFLMKVTNGSQNIE